ncbi:MAG: branched-chain-amino-acid transaminase [Armatimonadota bacterium]
MRRFVNLNGQMVSPAEAKIDLYDHGFLYGDGVFEGIRVYNGRVFKLQEHVDRLYHSARALMIGIPISKEEMTARIKMVVRENAETNCYIRVTVSRGVGLGLDPMHIRLEPTIAISTADLALYPREMYENGLHVVTVSTRIPPAQCLDPRIKSLGRYINNILAKMEANRVGAGEGLMLNVEGYVAEATGDNLFIVKNGALHTPPPSAGILAGITRATVMMLAEGLGIPVHETMMTLYDVYTADEAFLTGTAAEVIPMVTLDERPIGTGKPGEITQRIISAFREHTHSSGTPV